MTDDFDPSQLDPDEREEIVAQIPVVSAAWRFIIPALRDDGRPVPSLCWAQGWLGLNRADAEAEGYDLGQVAVALADEVPTHPLWRHFSRVLLRDLHGVADLDPDVCGVGANARVFGVDIELLYLQEKTGLEGDIWQTGVERLVLPIVMRLNDNQWRVLNYGSETIPIPGWPPTL